MSVGIPPGTSVIGAGSIHIESGEPLPKFLVLLSQSQPNSWPVVTNIRSTLEEEFRKAGWIFFFIAGKIEKTALGFSKQKALSAALRRLTASVKSLRYNSFEISNITSRQFLGMSWVSVSAHARHLQKGLVCLAD